MVTVFHRIEPNFLVEVNPNIDNYRKVAEVGTNSMEEAFMLTNNIEEEWSKNPKVKTFFFNSRSTSVGDLMVFRGNLYAVDNIGFKALDKALDNSFDSFISEKEQDNGNK